MERGARPRTSGVAAAATRSRSTSPRDRCEDEGSCCNQDIRTIRRRRDVHDGTTPDNVTRERKRGGRHSHASTAARHGEAGGGDGQSLGLQRGATGDPDVEMTEDDGRGGTGRASRQRRRRSPEQEKEDGATPRQGGDCQQSKRSRPVDQQPGSATPGRRAAPRTMETDHTWTLDDVEQEGAEGDDAEPDADVLEGEDDWFNEGARMGVSADQMRQLEDL
eukprot:2645684-Rhodomonas_salina.1